MRLFTKYLLLCVPALLLLHGTAPIARAQTVTQADLDHPKPDSWPTFNGDYSGRRYSPLKQINADTVKGLTLAWISRVNMQSPANLHGGPGSAPNPKRHRQQSRLAADGEWRLYMTEPNAMFAIDARTGREIWHYVWKGFPPNRWAIAAPASMATGSTSKPRTATSSRSI